MSSHALIADAHTLANQQMERMRILLLVLAEGEGRDILPDSQQKELDRWLFDLVDQAQQSIDAAADALADLRGCSE